MRVSFGEVTNLGEPSTGKGDEKKLSLALSAQYPGTQYEQRAAYSTANY